VLPGGREINKGGDFMKKPRFLNVWLFFASVYLVSFLLYMPILVSGQGVSTPLNKALMAAVTFVPSVMGVLFVYLTKGSEERRDFWRRAYRWPHRRTKMAITGILLMPLITLTSFMISSYLAGTGYSLAYAARVFTDWKALLVYLFVELTFGALSEELGWRGYALDELQSRWSALRSGLVLGFIWAFWHTPAFLIPGLSQYEMGGVSSWPYISFILSVAMGSVLITWVYNNTGRSILVAGFLMHFSQNATFILLGGIFDTFTVPSAYWTVALIEIAIAAALVLFLYGSKTLTRSISFQGLQSRQTASS
jgi:membrane protease YdiL (CAAX protease family)